MGIRNKMAKGAFWIFLEKGTQQVLAFVVFTIIASMIGPNEYGLVALCTVILSLAKNTTLGLVDSIISMKISDDERLSSLFWFVLAVGAFISVLSFFIAGYFASFFGEQKLKPLMQVFAVIPVLYALAAVPMGLITASMDFRIFTMRALIASLLGGGVGVYLAYNDWGAFAIAIQQIVFELVTVMILFISSTWRPGLIFNIYALKEMIHLGLGQSSSLLISFIEQQLPRLILGYFIGSTAVGHYAFVRRVLGVLQEGIIQPVLNVIHPAISKIIDKPEEKRAIIRQTVFILGAIIFPIVVGIILTAPLFVPFLFGSKWVESVGLIQIYAPALIFVSFNLFMRNILRAHQMVFLSVRMQAIITIFSTLGVYFVTPYGGGAYVLAVLVVASVLSTIAFSAILSAWVNMPIWKDYLSLLSPVLSSMAMIAPILIVQFLDVLVGNAGLTLSYSVVAGIITYFAVFAILERKRLQKVLSYARRIKE
jgi:PST family polysaccharide transporter